MKQENKLFDKLNIFEICIFLTGTILRILRLSSIPAGVYIDEPPISYSAWCIANYGVDRYLVKMPIYFRNWYSGQSPLYTYLLALLYKLGAPSGNVFVIRFPACFLGILIPVIVYLIAREITDYRPAHTFSVLLSSFCPYFFMQGRVGLDCNLLLFCVTLSFLFLIRYIKRKKPYDLVFCGISFGLSLYSYALSYILLAVFLIFFSLYLLWTKKAKIKEILIMALIVALTALPIILFAICVVFNTGEFSFAGFTIAPASQGRMAELSFANFFANAARYMKRSLTYDGHFTLTLKEFSTLYYISIPFAVAGIILSFINFAKSIRKKEFHIDTPFFLLYASNIFVGGLNSDILSYRINSVFLAYLYFTVKALCLFSECFKKISIKKVVFCIVASGYILYAGFFFKFYFCDYSTKYDGFVHSAKDAIDYWQSQNRAGEVYVDYYNLPELVLYEYPISPYEWSEAESVLNITPDIPEEIDPDKGYIVRKSNGAVINKLSDPKYGFGRKEFEYYVLYHPL